MVEGYLDFRAVVVSARVQVCFIGPRKSRSLTPEACEICIPPYTFPTTDTSPNQGVNIHYSQIRAGSEEILTIVKRLSLESADRGKFLFAGSLCSSKARDVPCFFWGVPADCEIATCAIHRVRGDRRAAVVVVVVSDYENIVLEKVTPKVKCQMLFRIVDDRIWVIRHSCSEVLGLKVLVLNTNAAARCCPP